jgi:LmbE family N-acetylglucosaminyl deacetylase
VDPVQTARRAYRSARELRERRELSRFRMALRFDPSAPALLLSPHWDDAVLDCWGVLSSDDPLVVANVFGGSPPPGRLADWDAITGARDSAQRTAERLAEDARALSLAGRTPITLGLLDAQYREGTPPSLAELEGLLTRELTSASRIYAPAAIGAHPDHRLARLYARQALALGIPVALYAELPYCVLHGWPHWVDGRERDARRDVDVFWSQFLGDVPELPPLDQATVLRLDDDQAAAKLAAMRCYETQLPALGYGGRGLLEDPEIHRYEVAWELRGV